MEIFTRSPTLSESQPAGIITAMLAKPKMLLIKPIWLIVRPVISCIKIDRKLNDILKNISRTPSVIMIHVNRPPASTSATMAPRSVFKPANDSLGRSAPCVRLASRAIETRMTVAAIYNTAATSSIILKPYWSTIHPPSSGPATPTTLNSVCVMPNSLARFSGAEWSAMKASKLGPTSERVIAPSTEATSTHSQVLARSSGTYTKIPITLPMAMAFSRPRESEIHPPSICSSNGMICDSV